MYIYIYIYIDISHWKIVEIRGSIKIFLYILKKKKKNNVGMLY